MFQSDLAQTLRIAVGEARMNAARRLQVAHFTFTLPFTAPHEMLIRLCIAGHMPNNAEHLRQIILKLTAVRKLVSEAQKSGMLTHEEAANLTDIPNVREKGARLGTG